MLQEKLNVLGIESNLYNKDKIYLIEAGALAHDIGNAPFGHHGERILGKLMQDFGGYEGNGQSLRILMNIEKKHPKFAGLNLTTRTLLSIIKYNKVFDGNPEVDKFLYKEEYDQLMEHLHATGLNDMLRTIDAQIIDAADEIAYCAHDLEDALAHNYFSIDEFLFDLENDAEMNKYPYKGELHIFKGWVQKARDMAQKSRVYHSSEEYSFIFRKELTSLMVNELTDNLDVLSVEDDLKDDFQAKTGTNQTYEIAFKNWQLVRAIKHWTFEGIKRSNDILFYEKLGTKVIKGLFEAYADDKFNKNMSLMPVEYRSKSEGNIHKFRRIADYIGGMMDPSAIEAYRKLYGDNEVKKLYKSNLMDI